MTIIMNNSIIIIIIFCFLYNIDNKNQYYNKDSANVHIINRARAPP